MEILFILVACLNISHQKYAFKLKYIYSLEISLTNCKHSGKKRHDIYNKIFAYQQHKFWA